MTTTAPAAGTIVEIDNSGSFSYAAVVEPQEYPHLDNPESRVWVRYDNGCVVPVPEYLVRALTPDQVVARLSGHANV